LGGPEEHEATRQREGVVLCSLRPHPQGGARPVAQRAGEDGEIDFVLANLECTIFPQGERSEEQVRRLESSFAALQRTLE